jgi:hypothetical protein
VFADVLRTACILAVDRGLDCFYAIHTTMRSIPTAPSRRPTR